MRNHRPQVRRMSPRTCLARVLRDLNIHTICVHDLCAVADRISGSLEFQYSTYFSYANVEVRNGTCSGQETLRAGIVGTPSSLALATR